MLVTSTFIVNSVYNITDFIFEVRIDSIILIFQSYWNGT